MKLLTKTMAVAAMMVASLGGIGCSTSGDAASPIAPEESPATAPVESSTTTQDARFFRFYAPVAPPMARFEVRGVAPSARHFWTPGYYRWSGREHVWMPGSWVLSRPGFVYAGPTWHRGFRHFEYTPGRWIRRF